MDEQRKTRGGVWIPIAGWWWWGRAVEAHSTGPQIALTHGDTPSVFGILHSATVKVLRTAHPHLGWTAALGEKRFASIFLGHQCCWLHLGMQEFRVVYYFIIRFQVADQSFMDLCGHFKDANIPKRWPKHYKITSQNAFHISHPIAQHNQITHHNLIAFGIFYPRQAPKVSATRQHCHISRWNTRKVLTASGGRGRREKLIRH